MGRISPLLVEFPIPKIYTLNQMYSDSYVQTLMHDMPLYRHSGKEKEPISFRYRLSNLLPLGVCDGCSYYVLAANA
jgi:hypothetical protein